MLRRSMAVAALVVLAACGGDSGTNPTTYPSMDGLWSGYDMWLTQFSRTRDNYNGTYTCPGQLTITHDTSRRTFSGFAVVDPPCQPLSFPLSGAIDTDNSVTITTAGPRPAAGTCPQFPVSTYTGTLSGNTLSVRASATVNCPGELEGDYSFSIILNARRSGT